MMRRIAIGFVRFYQKFISPITVGSCRYYPSCSEYAIWQFETNDFFRAFFASIFRVLRCNKLFDGGIEYPLINFTPPHLRPLGRHIKPIGEIKYFIVMQKHNFISIKILDK